MENAIITLKDLYRILTVKDYPIFSNGVISSRYKSGMTLTSFWYQTIIEEFRSGIYGRNLWDKSQHSYFSRLCNRKKGLPYLEEYSLEVFNSLNSDTMLAQIQKFMIYFEDHHYNSDVFRKKMTVFLQLCQDDPCLSKSDIRFLLHLYPAESDREIPEAFYDGWIFSVLSLIALFGNRNVSEKLIHLITDKNLVPKDLYISNSVKETGVLLPLKYRNASPFGKAEDLPLYFGRESELYELMEGINNNRKVFITGIGGIGKTELLRQLANTCTQNQKYTNIVAVQYGSTLKESLINSFSFINAADAEERFYDALYQIRTVSDGSVILLIDNAKVDENEELCWKELTLLPCPIIVTSRETAPEGFDEMKLTSLDQKSSLLLLRRHYQHSLREEERDLLKESLKNYEVLRHPLTLKLFACYAREKTAGIHQLVEMLKMISDEDRTNQNVPILKNIYRYLYKTSDLSDEKNHIIRIFSFIHYRQYALDEIHDFCFIDQAESYLQKKLDELVRQGWLEKKDEMYSMHPVIAECIREEKLSAEDFQEYLDYVSSLKNDEGYEIMLGNSQLPALFNEIGFNLLRICRYNSSYLTLDGFRLLIELLLLFPKSYIIKEEDYSLLKKYILNLEKPDTELELELLILGVLEVFSEDTGRIYTLFQKYLAETNDENKIYSIGGSILEIMTIKPIPLEELMKTVSLMTASIQNVYYLVNMYLKCILFCCIYYYKEEGETFIQKTETLIESTSYASISEECETKTGIYYFHKSYFEIIFGDIEQARRDYDKGKTYHNNLNLWTYTGYDLRIGGLLARLENRLEEAEVLLAEEAEMELRYMGHYSAPYTSVMGERAIVLNALGRTDEAIAIYQEIIPYGRIMQIYMLSVWLNNLGVAYLTKKDYPNAEECFLESIELVKGQAAIKTAEPECNLSKIARAKKEFQKEKELLKRCEPVFSEVYGNEHTKTIYIRNRLDELKEIQEESN